MPTLAPLAEIFGEPIHVVLGFVGVIIVGLAGWLHWRLTWLLSDVEEEEKDSKITAEQAKSRQWLLKAATPVLMAVGVVLLAIAAWAYFTGRR